ncbi:MAG: Hint domain-containing protein [Myxococcales bacterium]|nr:Hint domain-containing protein [Myxococcales bacterium]
MKKLLMGLGVASSIAACGPFPFCVARGSRVRTPTGPRRIEELEVGDEIVVADPATGLTAVSRLEAVLKSTRECGTLRFSGRALSVTSDHPLYDPQACGFFPAGDWLLGLRTHLFEITDSGATVVRVENFEAFTRIDDVFDLTVAHEWHTFVAEGVLVHNKQPANCSIPDGGFTTLGTPDELRPGCACMDGGVGRWTCGGSGGLALCQFCAAQDGGP